MDALPAVVTADPPASCPLCLEVLGAATAVRECPRCGLRACPGCWSRFAQGRCTTVGCGQPAALERPLWTPRVDEFVTATASAPATATVSADPAAPVPAHAAAPGGGTRASALR
jgi:hypothetical protein